MPKSRQRCVDELVELLERARVEQELDALARRQLALGVLALAALGAAALLGAPELVLQRPRFSSMRAPAGAAAAAAAAAVAARSPEDPDCLPSRSARAASGPTAFAVRAADGLAPGADVALELFVATVADVFVDGHSSLADQGRESGPFPEGVPEAIISPAPPAPPRCSGSPGVHGRTWTAALLGSLVAGLVDRGHRVDVQDAAFGCVVAQRRLLGRHLGDALRLLIGGRSDNAIAGEVRLG